jgi:hypothetical protein
VVVIISIVIGVVLIGTPVDQRNRRFDDSRIQSLQNLQSQIVNYWTQKQVLPEALGKLEDSISGFMVPTDPESKQAYDYKVVNELSFELCASFKTDNQDFLLTDKGVKMTSPYDSFQQNWNHKAEKTCFTRTIDPELYKPSVDNQEGKPMPIRQ